MRPYPTEESYKGLKGKKLYSVLLRNQRRWIEWCEAGSSYLDGERGLKIKEADYNELKRLEHLVSTFK